MIHRSCAPTWRRTTWILSLLAVATATGGTSASAQGASTTNARDVDDPATVTDRIADTIAFARELLSTPATEIGLGAPKPVEEELVDAQTSVILGHTAHAASILERIVSTHADKSGYADGLFLLGNLRFGTGDLAAARDLYELVVARGLDPAFRPHIDTSLSRLIAIAMDANDYDALDIYLAQVEELGSESMRTETTYFRAKYYFFQAVPEAMFREEEPREADELMVSVDDAKLAHAAKLFLQIQEREPHWDQARYFLGTIAVMRGTLPAAAEIFDGLVEVHLRANFEQRKLDRSTIEEIVHNPVARPVFEQATLARARVAYELDDLDRAIEAYNSVTPRSRFYDQAMYELAWVHLDNGATNKAAIALELLVLTMPDSSLVSDARLLQAMVLARSGKFEEATAKFVEVRADFDPVRAKLESIRAAHPNLSEHFAERIRASSNVFALGDYVPESALRAIPTDDRVKRADALVRSMTEISTTIEETKALAERVDALVRDKFHSAAFGDFRADQQQAELLLQRIVWLRSSLLDSVYAAQDLPEPEALVTARRAIEPRLAELDNTISASNPFADLRGAPGSNLGSTGAAAEEREKLRIQHARLTDQEAHALGVRAPSVARLFAAMSVEEQRLRLRADQRFRAAVARAANMEHEVIVARVALPLHAKQLVELRDESATVLSGLAADNFIRAQTRFADLGMKADLGIADVAWDVRESHRTRIEALTLDRSIELQRMDDEFRDVMDFGAQADKGAAATEPKREADAP